MCVVVGGPDWATDSLSTLCSLNTVTSVILSLCVLFVYILLLETFSKSNFLLTINKTVNGHYTQDLLCR